MELHVKFAIYFVIPQIIHILFYYFFFLLLRGRSAAESERLLTQYSAAAARKTQAGPSGKFVTLHSILQYMSVVKFIYYP